MEQTGFPFGRPAADTFPEPLDDFVVHFVPSVVGEFAPVVTRKNKGRIEVRYEDKNKERRMGKM